VVRLIHWGDDDGPGEFFDSVMGEVPPGFPSEEAFEQMAVTVIAACFYQGEDAPPEHEFAINVVETSPHGNHTVHRTYSNEESRRLVGLAIAMFARDGRLREEMRTAVLEIGREFLPGVTTEDPPVKGDFSSFPLPADMLVPRWG